VEDTAAKKMKMKSRAKRDRQPKGCPEGESPHGRIKKKKVQERSGIKKTKMPGDGVRFGSGVAGRGIDLFESHPSGHSSSDLDSQGKTGDSGLCRSWSLATRGKRKRKSKRKS